jgi:hypothetical protein
VAPRPGFRQGPGMMALVAERSPPFEHAHEGWQPATVTHSIDLFHGTGSAPGGLPAVAARGPVCAYLNAETSPRLLFKTRNEPWLGLGHRFGNRSDGPSDSSPDPQVLS